MKCEHIFVCASGSHNLSHSSKLAQACDINQFKRALTFKLRILIRTELVFPVSKPATTEILVRGGRRGPVKRIRIANDLTPGKEAELEN